MRSICLLGVQVAVEGEEWMVLAICLLGVQVAVEGEEWMVLAIDKYDYGIF